MPSRKSRVRTVIIIAEFLEGDGFSMEIDAFGERMTGVIGCEVMNIEHALLLEVSIRTVDVANGRFTL